MTGEVAAAALAAVADAPSVLERWARQPSGSHDQAGLAAMRALIADRAGSLGGVVEEVPLGAGEPALRVTGRPGAARRVLLVGHYDTVHTADDPGPAVVRVPPDVLRGPGVADMKGGILVMLGRARGPRGVAPRRLPGLGAPAHARRGARRAVVAAGAPGGGARARTPPWCSSPRRVTATWWWRAAGARCSRSMSPAGPPTRAAIPGTAAAPSAPWPS